MSTLGAVRRVAAVWCGQVDVTVVAVPPEPLHGELSMLGARFDVGSDGWRLPAEHADDLYATLDRLGYRWAADTAEAPRTWPQRMLAETPEHFHQRLIAAVQAALHTIGDNDAADHLALVDFAWQLHNVQHNGDRAG